MDKAYIEAMAELYLERLGSPYDAEKGYWIDAKNNKIPIKNMDPKHITNCILLMQRKGYGGDEKCYELMLELSKKLKQLKIV